MIKEREDITPMKKRFLAFFLAVCLAITALAVPATAAGNNTAIQTAVSLGGLTTEQTADLSAPLTRGQLARLLTAFSAYRTSTGSQSSIGTLFTDVDGSSPWAPYIRIAVQNGWMSGYTDGSFRPDNAVTLEEACTAALCLLGYDITTLSGSFPAAQLNKAEALGLRAGLGRSQGEALTLEDGAVLLYNALTANTKDGQVYATTLGFTVNNGEVDTSSVLLSNLKGPFVAGASTTLPFEPVAIYRNDEITTSLELNQYDVYYYSESTRTVWIYTRRAAGRVTAVAPSASAPTSVTVAGTEYTIADASAAYTLSSLSGGGVGQVVTLLLGMNNEVVQVLTGQQADAAFYGVVQTSTRNLVESNGADVRQAVSVLCTDGVTRTVNVDKQLNYPAGWLVEITVDAEGEHIQALDLKSIAGTISADGTSLGSYSFANDIEILDTTSEGVAGTIRPSRLSGVTLSESDIRYYTLNENGEIDRLILDDVTGDLWEYATLDDVKNLTTVVGDQIDSAIQSALGTSTGGGSTGSSAGSSVSTLVSTLLPSTSDILYGIIDGSITSTLWSKITSSTSQLASWLLNLGASSTTGPISDILSFFGSGATYVCYVDGKQVSYQTSVKYPVVAGGVAVSKSTSGGVKNMIQLMPTIIDHLGPAYVMSGDTRYETADDMQVYLWYSGQYFPTTLSQVNTEEYTLIGWYDNFGCAAGQKVRLLIAVKNN